MGNSPYVSGPDRGGAPAEGDMINDDQLAGRRPVRSNVAEHKPELAHSQAALENNRKSQLSEASSRKSSDINVPELSFSHITVRHGSADTVVRAMNDFNGKCYFSGSDSCETF